MRAIGAALFSMLAAACTTGGLASLEVGNPAYNGTEVASAATDVADSADANGITPLTVEQQADIDETAFVPVPKPANPAAAATASEDVPATEKLAAVEQKTATAGSQTAAAAVPAPSPKPIVDVAASPSSKQTLENQAEPDVVATSFAPPPPKKRGFLASLFSQKPQDAPVMSAKPVAKPKQVIKLASAAPVEESEARASLGGDDALPGVRQSSLFEITRKSGLDDDSDVDLHEDEDAPVNFASAAGMGRLAPNGLLTQRPSVDVACLKPSLVRMLKQVERHYGKRMVITSGYRSPSHNRRVRGARRSMHMYCAAVDVQIAGVSKWELARYARSMSGRGGVGTYCHTNSVHIDVGPERDWNWRCRRRKS